MVRRFAGSRAATDVDITGHESAAGAYLIGPVDGNS